VGAFTGPYVFVTDLSFRKYFKLPRENMGLMFESDFFNIFKPRELFAGQPGQRVLDSWLRQLRKLWKRQQPAQWSVRLKFNF